MHVAFIAEKLDRMWTACGAALVEARGERPSGIEYALLDVQRALAHLRDELEDAREPEILVNGF